MAAPIIAEISELSIADRIQLVEDVWDSIAVSPDQLPVTEAQQTELDYRLAAYEQYRQAGSAWKDVKKRVTSRE